MTFNPLTALSPLDGRYAGKVDALREHFFDNRINFLFHLIIINH